MDAVPVWPSRGVVIDPSDRWKSAVLRTSFVTVVSPFRVFVVFVRDFGDVAGHAVHQLGHCTGDVLV